MYSCSSLFVGLMPPLPSPVCEIFPLLEMMDLVQVGAVRLSQLSQEQKSTRSGSRGGRRLQKVEMRVNMKTR